MRKLVILLTGIVSFIIAQKARFFFQDDWNHLYQVAFIKLNSVWSFFNLWTRQPLDPVKFFRPIPTKLYYFLAWNVFHLNYFWYFLVNCLLFVIVLILLIKIVKLLLPKLVNWVNFFFVFSVTNLVFFSYISAGEVLWFVGFSLICFLAWLKQKRFVSWLGLMGALMSRETAIILPFLIFWYEWIGNKKTLLVSIKKLGWFWITLGVYGLSRSFFYGWPTDRAVYQLKVGFEALNNLVTYLLWQFNIIGLIKQNSGLAYGYIAIVVVWISLLILGGVKALKQTKERRWLVFASGWWLIGMLPVLMLPNHIDPWNLLLSSLGAAIWLGISVNKLNKITQKVVVVSYLITFFLGLNYYALNHWTIERAATSKEMATVIMPQCNREKVIIKTNGKDRFNELIFPFAEKAVKVLCNNQNLDLSYEK